MGMSCEEYCIRRKVMGMEVQWRSGRPKRRWLDSVRDIREKGLSEEVYKQAFIVIHRLHITVGF